MISASPHGKKEAAARFLVGGSDGSSRISFGWNRKLASKMLRQCDSAAKAAICFAYRCNASSHALAAAISASLQGEKRGSGSSRGSAQHDFSFASWGKKGSCGSLSRRRQRWKLTHQLWVESQTRIKDAQTVRFRSQSCHLFRLSLQRLLTRSRSCYFSFAAGGKKRKRLLARLSTGMISAMLYEKGKSAAFFFQKHKTAETLPYFTCSSPETAAACFTGFG